MKFRLFPEQASTMAPEVDHLYYFLIGTSLFFILIIFGPMIYFGFKYRGTKMADRSPTHVPTWKLEVAWTIFPLFLAVVIFLWAAHLYFRMQRLPEEGLDINVIGKQWMWKIQHQQGNREINELHVPLGRTVRLFMTSQDVIHSFFIPAFRIKQDVLPGRYTSQWFRATKTGEFHLFCAEYCGNKHSGMIGRVVVMDPPDYEKWLINGAPGETLVATGGRLFRELGCSGCHGESSRIRAPRLEGIFGKPVPLQNGEMVIADRKYIRDSILLPELQIAAGYAPVMPSFAGRISEEELLEVISYIESLANASPGKNP